MFLRTLYYLLYMNNIELQKIADESYNEFMLDESIIGFEGLLKSKNIGGGSRRRNKIRALIYDKYGKDNLIALYRIRLAKLAHKNRTKESYYISLEQREKMTLGVKKYWNNNDKAKMRSRKLMISYCNPNSHTPDANKHRVESRKGYRHSAETICKIKNAQVGRPLSISHRKALRVRKSRAGSLGLKRSNETKKKLSAITKKQWKSGIHIPTYRSKGQREVASILRNFEYTVKEEFFINGRPYDVFVKEKNLLIEFNGTFWHRDPRFYPKSDICQKVWDNDKIKMENAKQNGYDIIVVWQYDWEHAIEKKKYIMEVINGSK